MSARISLTRIRYNLSGSDSSSQLTDKVRNQGKYYLINQTLGGPLVRALRARAGILTKSPRESESLWS